MGKTSPDLARLLGLSNDDEDEDRKARPLPEAQAADLREAYQNYERSLTGCPYRAGELVTPARGSNIKHHGEPCIVLETLPYTEPDFEHARSDDTGASSYGRRLDMRVLFVADNGTRAPFWCESWEFEPYTGPGGDVAGSGSNANTKAHANT